MAIPSSGAVSISDLVTEFGGTAPHSMSEYYRGGSFVPSTKQATVTAGSTTINQQIDAQRGSGFTTNPTWNSNGRIFTVYLWADNGANGVWDCQWTVNQTGTYTASFNSFISSADGGLTTSFVIYKNGTQLDTYSRSTGDPQSRSEVRTYSYSSGDTVRITGNWGSRGWASCGCTFGGSSQNNNTVTQNTNTGVPTSGVITLEDFYGSSA